jgi:choloylglycine hydrolase
MSDQKSLVYYFESAFSPYLFWVELKNLDFGAGSPVRKLSLTENSALLVGGKFVSGEVTRHFKTASPFAFAGVKH